MEKKVIRQRMRGLLALVLALMMMFGTSMTVFAKEYVIGGACTLDELKENLDRKILYVGDSISCGGSGAQVYVYMPGESIALVREGIGQSGQPAQQGYPIFKYKSTITGRESDRYSVARYETIQMDNGDECYRVYLSYYREPELTPQENSQSGSGTSHKHYYQWKETLEATATSDGLLENICECGAVSDRVVVPGAMAYFKQFCEKIQNAPENSTVEWNPLNNRCYTRRMMEELAKRPDITLKTTYTEPDGSIKSFTIPAGGAPADGELFYGFTYLGNLYGWN